MTLSTMQLTTSQELEIFPKSKTYVTYSIDPYATLELDPSEPSYRQELQSIMTRKYIGLVYNCLDVMYFDSNPNHRWRIFHVRKGPPPSFFDEKEYIDSDMCIPVGNCSNNPTPWNPLTLSKPFPWQDCFHPSFYEDTQVRIPTTKTSLTPQYAISTEEYRRFEKCQANDGRRSARLQEEMALDPNHRPYDDYNLSPYKPNIEMIQQDLMPIVNCSYDLDNLDDFDDPFQFFKDVMFLVGLQKELKQNAIEKAREIDEKAFPYTKPIMEGANPISSSRVENIRRTVSSIRQTLRLRLGVFVGVLTCGVVSPSKDMPLP